MRSEAAQDRVQAALAGCQHRMHALSYYRRIEVITEKSDKSDHELVVGGVNLILSDTDVRHRNSRTGMV